MICTYDIIICRMYKMIKYQTYLKVIDYFVKWNIFFFFPRILKLDVLINLSLSCKAKCWAILLVSFSAKIASFKRRD